MAKLKSFNLDKTTLDMSLYRGDTASFWIHAVKRSGDDWTDDDRMKFTVISPSGNIVMERHYRLDDQWSKGDGYALIEFHNADTEALDPGQYTLEIRFYIDAIWDGTPSTARCVNALAEGEAQLIDGGDIKTVIHAALELRNVYGED